VTSLPPSTPPLSQAPAPKHDAYAALRIADYRRFAGGFAVASMGMQMQGMALMWEIYERTGSASHLGYVGLCRALPVLVLALPAGQIVDTLNRKWVLVGTQVAFALVSGLLAWASYAHAPVWLMYALIVLSGCARVFNGPTRSAILPLIVPVNVFRNAVTWNSSVFHACAMIGPIVAGWIIRQMGAIAGYDLTSKHAWPVYAITGIGCLIFAFSASFMNPRHQERATEGLSIRGIWSGMFAGARHLWREKTILGAITLDLMAVLLGGATALLPIYAKDILHVDALHLGFLKAAPYTGAVIMGFYMAHRPPLKKNGRALLLSVAGFGMATVVFGLSQIFWISFAALFVAGALDNISVIVRHVLVQMRTPEMLRGRVAAVNSVFIESSNEIGAFESGTVASLAGSWLGSVARGAMFSAVSGGVGTVLVVMVLARVFPELRRLGRLEDDLHAPPHAPGVPAEPAPPSVQEQIAETETVTTMPR
jgi:MFS family permease